MGTPEGPSIRFGAGVGTCNKCKAKGLPTSDGKVIAHRFGSGDPPVAIESLEVYARGVRSRPYLDDIARCLGSTKFSSEAMDYERLKRFAAALRAEQLRDRPMKPFDRKMHLIRLAAPLARIVLDSVLIGRTQLPIDERHEREHVGSPFRLEVEWLLQLAIVAWRLQTEGANGAVIQPYKLVYRHGQATRLHGSVDVYCTFCGELLRAGVDLYKRAKNNASKENLFHSTKIHTIPCALTRLSGMKDFAPRGTLRLPAEYQPDPQNGVTDADRTDP